MAKNKHERICQVNPKHKYTYCPYCGEYAHLPGWMIGFCSQNCHDIYNIVMDFKVGRYSQEQAYAKLMKCDLSEKDDFASYILEPVNTILSFKKDVDVDAPKVDEPVKDEIPVKEEVPVEGATHVEEVKPVETKIHETVSDEFKKQNRKLSYKYNKKN